MATTLPTKATMPDRALPHPRPLGAALRRNLMAYMFLLPYLIILFVFTIGAAFYGVGLSLFHVNLGIGQPHWIGLKNYQYIWDQTISQYSCAHIWDMLAPGSQCETFPFAMALKDVVFYAFFVIIGQTILALFYALLLNQHLAGRAFFRTAIYLPSVTSSVAISLIFLFLYNKGGAINGFLGMLHLPQPDWLGDPSTALPAIMALNIWTTAPTFMIMFLAALQGLPESLYEAARVDGATTWGLFRHITLPLLRPTLFLVTALGTIGSLQVFDQVRIMTQGGPLNSTLTPVYTIYDYGFRQGAFGLAAAMAVVLFVLIFTITLIQRRFIDTNIQY